MRLSPASFLALLPVFLSACATHPLDVQRDYDPKFNFGHVRTFDFAGGTLETEAAKKTAERLHLDALLGSEIKRQMEERGYRQSSTQPDVRIAYSFGEWTLDSHKKPNGGYGAVGIMFPGAHGSLLPEGSDGRVPPPSENPYTSQYEEARLEILMIDPTSGKIIWNAGIKDKHDFGYFRSSQPAQIEKGVVTLLEGFPPDSANPR